MKKIAFALVLVALTASCAKNEITQDVNNTAVRFTSVVGNNTRATTGLIDLPALKSSTDGFEVCTNGLGASGEMHNVKVTYNGTAWTYTGDYYWPLSATQDVAFTAYAPAGTANVALTSAGLTATNFVPAATAANQIDLIYAAPANFNRLGSGVNGVALTFNHILTQVVFSVSTDIPAADNPLISSIVLTVPQNQGSYNGTTWTAASNSQTYTLFNNTVIGSTPVSSTPLLLIPQTIPAGTTAAITFSVNGSSTTSTVALNSLTTVTSWQPGTKVTYNILFNNADLKIKFADPTVTTWNNTSDGIIY